MLDGGLGYRTRMIVLGAAVVVALAAINNQIVHKERILAHGDTVLLRLAPRDPRSLLQGDYMDLRYAMANEVSQAAYQAQVIDGRAIIELAEGGVARFVAIDEGQQLASNQRLLRFRKRGETLRLASDAFFFEEGTWETYSAARYGALRVDDDGEAVLIALYDDDLNRLGEPLHQ